ncbi:MAG: phosphoribosylanthranilate isomerase, partial [Bacteroidota bacterium]
GPSFDPTDLLRYQVDAYLLDTQVPGYYGGSGHSFDWNVAVAAKHYGKIILSGGLNLSNVEAALRFVRPYGVDVCSGIESKPGKKDLNMVRDFIARAKSFVYR